MRSEEQAAIRQAAQPYDARLRLGPSGSGGGQTEVAAACLRDASVLDRHLKTFGARYPNGDDRAVASLWSKRYLATLLPAPLAVVARTGSGLDAGADACRIVFAEDAPAMLRLPQPAQLPADRAIERLFAGHVAPLLAAIRACSGLSPRVLWSNTGNVAASILGNLAREPGAPETAAAVYRMLIDAPRVAWHPGPNPLFGAVTWLPLDEPDLPPCVHRRRLCCLRWRLSEPHCYSCPRIDLARSKELLRGKDG